jgi:hypothetical protein
LFLDITESQAKCRKCTEGFAKLTSIGTHYVYMQSMDISLVRC